MLNDSGQQQSTKSSADTNVVNEFVENCIHNLHYPIDYDLQGNICQITFLIQGFVLTNAIYNINIKRK